MVCQGQDKVCRTTLDVCLDRPQTTSQIRKLAGLKVGTLGPASELLGDLEQSALSLDLRVPASKMEEVGPAPFRVLPVLRAYCEGEELSLGLPGKEPGQEKLGVGRDIQLLPSPAPGNRGLFQGLGVLSGLNEGLGEPGWATRPSSLLGGIDS